MLPLLLGPILLRVILPLLVHLEPLLRPLAHLVHSLMLRTLAGVLRVWVSMEVTVILSLPLRLLLVSGILISRLASIVLTRAWTR